MDPAAIESLLNEVREGHTGVADALERLRHLPFEDLGFAKLDHHRALRTGMPEVIFAAGKTTEQVTSIFTRMANAGGNVLATRASREMLEAIQVVEPRAKFHEAARAITLTQNVSLVPGKGTIAVVCAGTSDLPVAEEAAVTAQLMGNDVELIADVGVAGIHRLLAENVAAIGAGADCVRGHGGRAAHCGGRDGARAGAGSADQRGLWRVVWRRSGAAGDAQLLLPECLRGEYR